MDETQREWERRYGPVAAGAAVAGTLLLLGQVLFQAVALSDAGSGDRGGLLAIHEHQGPFVASSVCAALSGIALAVVFWYLFHVTRHRRRELPGQLIYLIYLGALLYVAARIAAAVHTVDVADRFVTGAAHTERRADDLLKDGSAVIGGLGLVSNLIVAILFVLLSLNAGRAGVLSRFMSIIGVIVGASAVLLAGGSLVIEIFWLGALAVLFLDRWPGGRGPAWEAGVAEPWLTAAQRRRLEAEESAPAEPETPALRSSRKRNRNPR
jgi:hypothetical protein